MKQEDGLEEGDVVQIDPKYDDRFGGCFMTVTDVRAWGAVGYFGIPGEKGVAYYRCKWEGMEKVGRAQWMMGEPPAEEPT